MPSITVFNTSSSPLTLQVNHGPLVTCAGATPPALAPQSPSSGGPGWSNTSAGPNMFAPGQNMLLVTPQGSSQPLFVTIHIPGNIHWTNAQLYLFTSPGGSALSWVLLNNGTVVNGNLTA